jgi:Ras-related protein Rab-5C
MESSKVAFVGPCAVGKTSIINRLVTDSFNPRPDNTAGANFLLYEAHTTSGTITLRIWDTAGQEKYKSLSPMYARRAAGLVVVFDASDSSTFKEARQWWETCREGAGGLQRVWFVANKIDLDHGSLSDEREFAAASDAGFHVTSAKTGQGIMELFQEIAEQLQERDGEAQKAMIERREGANRGKAECCS